MRNVLLLTGMIAWSIGVLDGCGDGEASTTYSGGPVSKSALPGTLANVFCSTLKPCCDDAGNSFDVDACENTFSSALAAMFSSADSSKYTYDPDAAGACLGALQDAELCSGQTEPIAVDALCANAFEGTVPPGGTCTADIECAAPAESSVKCEVLTEDEGGTCVVETTAGLGDPCYWTCTAEGASQTCFVAVRRVDAPPEQPRCFTNDGMYCTSSGQCVARLGPDAPCEQNDDCADGMFCDESSRVCSELLAEGEPCIFDGCSEGFYCKNGLCAPQVGVGAVCDPSDDACAMGFCDQGTCVEGGGLSDLGVTLLCGIASGGQPPG